MIYLACPYSHPLSQTRRRRFYQVSRFAAKLIAEGHHVFSSISHSHPIAMQGKLAGDWKQWREFDLAMLSKCDELWILKLPGWKESKGIKAEIRFAEKRGMKIEFIDPK